MNRFYELWDELYEGKNHDLLEEFLYEIAELKTKLKIQEENSLWYKDAIVYSLYVDLFNSDFNGLTDKLDYLSELGVSCLWLLPVLDSPMRDAGFDIRNYQRIRNDLFGFSDDYKGDTAEEFRKFLKIAHKKGLKVIFDIAINHTSDKHPWFLESRKSPDNEFRDYYIWNKDKELYKETRLLFKGMCPSNWEKDGDCYYFHRFFEHQPDLNYRNPKVLIEMSRNFVFWIEKGVDGFRADAIPYLWKEEGTDCENLPKTHIVVKFFRAVTDFLNPNTLILAEACQKPHEVVKYFGTGDECHAGYHFPLMPQMFKALAMQNGEAIIKTLSVDITPEIPDDSQWFTFLRCHDELSLELVYVSEEDRKYIHENYCHKPQWDFRVGEGISARLSELFNRDNRKILLAYSIMLTLPGTPIIYYGDEFAKTNDERFYKEQIKHTGHDDTRFLVRGRIDWNDLEKEMKNPDSLQSKVFYGLKKMLAVRKMSKAFGNGELLWRKTENKDKYDSGKVLCYHRKFDDENYLIINNLSENEQEIKIDKMSFPKIDALGKDLQFRDNVLILNAFDYLWIRV